MPRRLIRHTHPVEAIGDPGAMSSRDTWCSSSMTPMAFQPTSDRGYRPRERSLQIDREGFEREMDTQRIGMPARQASSIVEQTAEFDIDGETDFTGHERLYGTLPSRCVVQRRRVG